MDVTITANVDKALSLLAKMSAQASDLRPVFQGPIERSVTVMFIRQFETAGKFAGDPWPPLSPVTVMLRSRALETHKPGKGKAGPSYLAGVQSKRGRARAGLYAPLRDTLRLWAAYTKAGGPESIRLFTPSSYERGVNVPYAIKHQKGDPKTRTPIRRVIPDPMPAKLTATWRAMLAHYVVTGQLTGARGKSGTTLAPGGLGV